MAQNRPDCASSVRRWTDVGYVFVLLLLLSLQKEVYMIAAGVIGGVFLVCTLVMFLGVKERDGEFLSGESENFANVDWRQIKKKKKWTDDLKCKATHAIVLVV